jgi:sporulation protein YlmC with PRC-barrel domain
MKTLLTFILSAAMTLSLAAGASAQSLDPYYETLAQYNSIAPKQNPQWEGAESTMKSNIQDNKNKVIGDLKNIIVSENGSIQSLEVDLNRIQLGATSLNYRELQIKSSARSYALAMDDKRIKEVFPEILAGIDTAAGDSTSSISVKNLVGADIRADDGRRIGKVDDVMFSRNGDRVTALLVNVKYKTIRGETIALPFSSVEYLPKGTGFEVLLADQQADTVLEFADR